MLIKQVNKKVRVFKTVESLIDFGIGKWVDICVKAIKSKDRCVIALSGGKTPSTFFKKLASIKDNLLWSKIYIFLVDERFVPNDDPDSNYRMIKENFLNVIDIPKENIYPIAIEDTASISAQKFEQQIQQFFNLREGQLPQFDLVMLGIGEDGHTASLFADDAALSEKQHLAVSVSREQIKHERITMTLPAINNANNIIFLVSGKSKAGAIKEIIEVSESKLPVALVNPKQADILFLLDNNAGSLLTGGGP